MILLMKKKGNNNDPQDDEDKNEKKLNNAPMRFKEDTIPEAEPEQHVDNARVTDETA